MIEWWKSNARYSKQTLGELNMLARVMPTGHRDVEGVSNNPEIVCNVGG